MPVFNADGGKTARDQDQSGTDKDVRKHGGCSDTMCLFVWAPSSYHTKIGALHRSAFDKLNPCLRLVPFMVAGLQFRDFAA